jgi:hypothetical protein
MVIYNNHRFFHQFNSLDCMLTIAAKSSAFNAPPINPPSTSGLRNLFVSGLTLPP